MHVPGRRRILIDKQPPVVEVACFLRQVPANMCSEDQATPVSDPITKGEGLNAALLSKSKGMNDLGNDTLGCVSFTSLGWTACTPDAVLLVERQDYDLIADPTSYAPERRSTAGLDPRLSSNQPYMNCSRRDVAEGWSLSYHRYGARLHATAHNAMGECNSERIG